MEIVSRDRALLLTAIVAALLGACSSEQAPPSNQMVGGKQASAPDVEVPKVERPEAPKPGTDVPLLTAEGWGPLRIGMSREEVTRALGADANPEAVGGADPSSCDQYRPERAPAGLLVMIEEGRLTRLSLINDSRVKTDRGLGLGAAASAVRAAYGDTAPSSPHKYEPAPAEYLTFWTNDAPTGDARKPSARGIRYEVDQSGKVGAIHAGGPGIEYVEGCS